MRNLLKFWNAELARNPVVWAPLACLIVSCAMNTHAGFMLGNGSIFIPTIMLAIAIMTAYCGTTGLELPEWSLRKVFLVGFLIVGIVVDQFSAWQTLGIQFADGQMARDSKATGLSTAADTLKQKREERSGIGRTRPVESIEAEAFLECKVIGPKCTALRSELGRAKRALQLDGEIAKAVAALEGREQVAAGKVQFTVPIQIAQATLDWWHKPAKGPTVEGDHILFAVTMLLSAVVCFLANVGFWLCGVGHTPAPAARRDDDGGGPGSPWPVDVPPLPSDFSPRGLLAPPRAPALLSAPAAATLAGAPGGGSSVNITIGGMPAAQAPAGATPAAEPEVIEPDPVAAPRGPRRDLDTLSGEAPIDRSRVRRELSPAEREAADVLLAFQAACLVDTPSGLVTGENIYRRYQAWAGERAIDPTAFLALFPDVTGIEMAPIGDVWHAKNVALRAGAALQSVEATRAA